MGEERFVARGFRAMQPGHCKIPGGEGGGSGSRQVLELPPDLLKSCHVVW